MNAEPDGFVVDLTELEALAGKADVLSETIRTAWLRDWFEDENWPDHDPLRPAVIAYRRSLQAAMERLSTGADRLAGHLRATAERYENIDVRAARAFDHLAGSDRGVEGAHGAADS